MQAGKYLIFLVVVYMASCVVHRPAVAPIRALIVTGMDIPVHDWAATTTAISEELSKDSRIKVDVLSNPYRLDSVQLENYQVVLLNFNNFEKPDPDEKAKENLKKFVSGGGGLVIMHFACGAFGNWPEFSKMAGMVWDRKNTHDPRGPFEVQLTDSSHPVTREMKSYQTDDELYICLTGQQPLHLLARARSKITASYHPMAFVLSYGKGHVFHTTLGHDARAIHIPGTAQLIRAGVVWAGYHHHHM